MKSQNLKRWACYIQYAIPFLLLLYSIKIALKPSDFVVFLKAASMITDGTSPYNEWIFVSEGNFCHYFYSPFWAVTLIPLSYLPDFVPQYLWLVLNVFFLVRIRQLLKAYFPEEGLSKRANGIVLILCLAFVLRFVLYNFEMIQMTIFLVWGGLEAMRLTNKGKWIWAGVILAFIINVKLLPLVLLPYLIYKGAFKTVFSTIFFSGIFFLLPAITVGWDFNWTLHQEWFSVINPANSEHLLEADLGPHSLTALIPTLLTSTEGVIPNDRTIMDLSVENAVLVLNLVRLFLIGLTLYFLKWPPFKGEQTKQQELYSLSYLFLLIPLIFPHQQKYAFFCIVPSIFYLSNYLLIKYTDMESPRKYVVISLLVIIFLCLTATTDGLVGRELNTIFQHYKLITYGALLLIPVLMLCRPETELR